MSQREVYYQSRRDAARIEKLKSKGWIVLMTSTSAQIFWPLKALDQLVTGIKKTLRETGRPVPIAEGTNMNSPALGHITDVVRVGDQVLVKIDSPIKDRVTCAFSISLVEKETA